MSGADWNQFRSSRGEIRWKAWKADLARRELEELKRRLECAERRAQYLEEDLTKARAELAEWRRAHEMEP